MNRRRMRIVAARVKSTLALVVLAAGCGPTYLAARPSEPLAADEHRVHVELSRLWLTEAVRDVGLDDNVDLVVELGVRNDGARERKISPGSLSVWMILDDRRPGDTLSLLPGGGGEGAFPGGEPDEGSLLLPVTIPAGQSRTVWSIFHGYRFEGSDRPRRVTLKVPLDDGELALDLADPARGALRWEAPPRRAAIAVGLHNVALVGGGLRGTMPGADVAVVGRRGPILWNLGLISSTLIQTQGPLQSGTTSFMGIGLQAHLAAPLVSLGAPADPWQIGVYAGGTAQGLIEIETTAETTANAMKMIQPRSYGLTTLEAGLELDFGAMRFAASPFPLVPDRRPLPRWSLRIGYVQGWSGGASGGGFVENLRFVF
jgi:hypothetical protein